MLSSEGVSLKTLPVTVGADKDADLLGHILNSVAVWPSALQEQDTAQGGHSTSSMKNIVERGYH